MENWLISLVGRVKLLVGHGVLPPCLGYQERDLRRQVMGEAAQASQRAVCMLPVAPAGGLCRPGPGPPTETWEAPVRPGHSRGVTLRQAVARLGAPAAGRNLELPAKSPRGCQCPVPVASMALNFAPKLPMPGPRSDINLNDGTLS